MKCPICYATQKIFENEIVHVCPYCDAILIYDGSLKKVDFFPWWIKNKMKLSENEGIIVTENELFHFHYEGKWILNNYYEMVKSDNRKGDMDRTVIEIYGKLPIFALPGMKIVVEKNEDIIITHQRGSTIFKRFKE